MPSHSGAVEPGLHGGGVRVLPFQLRVEAFDYTKRMTSIDSIRSFQAETPSGDRSTLRRRVEYQYRKLCFHQFQLRVY